MKLVGVDTVELYVLCRICVLDKSLKVYALSSIVVGDCLRREGGLVGHHLMVHRWVTQKNKLRNEREIVIVHRCSLLSPVTQAAVC